MTLIDYGIMQEKSDYRVHVCFGEGFAYLFKTKDGKEACETAKGKGYKPLPAYQPGVRGATAEGFVIRPVNIHGCQRIEIPPDIKFSTLVYPRASTTEKGDAAVRCAQLMFRRGLLPIELDMAFIEEKDIQILGCDLVVQGKPRIEVKCDYNGGQNGTGNLYLQISERNPLNKH